MENVGFQFLSLRQLLREQLSPLVFERTENANNHRLPQGKLRTSLGTLRAEILSPRLLFSEPPDCADLVRNHKRLIFIRFA